MTASVLIIADQPEFAREIVSHWQMERVVPAFTVLSSEFFSSAQQAPCDLAIVGGSTLPPRKLTIMLRNMEAMNTPAICVLDDSMSFERLRQDAPRTARVLRKDSWLDVLVVLGSEMLRRSESTAKLKVADQTAQTQSRQAALGQYMLQTRHGFNNALTSVLGNAELLLLESANLTPLMREQVDTIHSMSLRLHEMMQRFSSLEAELEVGQPENGRAEAYAQGS